MIRYNLTIFYLCYSSFTYNTRNLMESVVCNDYSSFYDYDSFDYLTAIEHSDNTREYFTYTEEGFLSTRKHYQHGALPRSQSFMYNGDGTVSVRSIPENSIVTYWLSDSGSIDAMKAPDKLISKFISKVSQDIVIHGDKVSTFCTCMLILLDSFS